MAPPKIWKCRGVQWLCPNRSESVKMGGNYFFLFAYDMEDTLMYFLVESCKEIRHKRSTTGNSKHMNAKHGKIGRITEVDVHIISVRISFFQKSNQPQPVAFFRFTPCRSPDVHWHKSRRFVRLFTSDGIDDTAMFCLESWRLATKGLPESSNQMWNLCLFNHKNRPGIWTLKINTLRRVSVHSDW